ncbi:MAG TPA: alpha/beta hydrolase [Actinocrinis sp.]|uniref:alpha/beta fold hydrolase n=1 Tax=Actinocrinis sp. TaxID=1920516 RepID=UPI002DDCEE73|nr:alpha/beta hydrolase [Actinocrinis sp.]HEV2347517.1 alpha/beta hydrolase [Actinocrinis sp.]
MPRAKANGIELEYDTFGDPADPALLLIMGLASQLISWDPEFCGLLAGRGYFVIRFDNRDIGLSTEFGHLPTPDLYAILTGDLSTAPYVMADMAQDTAGLLDALGIERAHVVGASMGGMIAQELAIKHPERVLSLCSFMSNTGDGKNGLPSQEALAAVNAPRGADRAEAIERTVNVLRIIGSATPEYAVTDEWRYARATRIYDRSYRPDGGARQVAAIAASPDRTEALGSLPMPVLVMHGDQDPLVDVSGGYATAAAVPGCELIVFPGQGHDLPRPLWPAFADAIVQNARKAAA